MDNSTFREILQRDYETLRAVVAGLKELELRWKQARISVNARQRGYFTPDEDDCVRQMLLSYRNYRLALYQIIERYWGYRTIERQEDQLRALVMGLAAALTVYSNSLKLIQTYEHEALVRKKLNEPDAKFDLEAGFFDAILRGYSSLGNYRELIRGVWFWQAHRREIQKFAVDPEWSWLIHVVRSERVVVRQRLTKVLLCRLRYDWRAFWRTTVLPVRRTRYGVQSLIGEACAGLRTAGPYTPGLGRDVLASLRPMLRPGDVLLVRAEGKLTAALLPGFWAHAALYLGNRSDLEGLGLNSYPAVARHLPALDRAAEPFGGVIEAISPCVLLNGLEHCLHADHVVVLRPNLPPAEITSAIAEAFGHLGKAYDFEFDFNVSTRLVCTELVYRCYHKRGTIEFPLIKRLGRFTLTADDIANLVLDRTSSGAQGSAPFAVTSLLLKTGDGPAHFARPEEHLPTLERIRSGWRPSQPTEALHA
jgi:hypothetical protein